VAFIHLALRQPSLALPVLLTIFTIGIVIGLSVYGFCIHRSGALKRSGKGDIEQGRYAGGTPKATLQSWGAYSKQLGRDITRKISALSSQISRRPTAVVATKKPESFTILPEKPSFSVPQEVSESHAGVAESSSIIGAPIMPVRTITASRPTSSVTIPTSRGVTETGASLSPPTRPVPPSNDTGLRPAPSKPNTRGQGKPLPILPALHLGRQETQRRYGLPTEGSRMEAMRPTARSNSINVVEPNRRRASSLPPIRRSMSAGAVAGLDSPPTHLAQVPISALPPATPIASNIRRYSQVSSGLRATTHGASSRKRSDTIESVVVVQQVPFVIASPTVPSRLNLSIDTAPRTPFPTIRPNPKPLDIPLSPSRSDEDYHIDPFYEIPQTAMTAHSGYSMALPDSGSLLPTSFGTAQDEAVLSLPHTSNGRKDA
jgi:hypothetical protein